MWRLQITCPMYTSVCYFRKMCMAIEYNVWWLVCQYKPKMQKRCKLVFKMVCGCHLRHKYKKLTCRLCKCASLDTIEHALFECVTLQENRSQCLSALYDSMPTGMRGSFNILDLLAKTEFLLSGFNVRFTPEWLPVYVASLFFISEIYTSKLSKEKEMDHTT